MTLDKRFWHDRPVMYRVLDADGRLIYVGQSTDLSRRVAQHRSESWWWQLLAARLTVQVFPDREAAKAAEKVAIQEELPVFNAQGYGDWRDRPYWSEADHLLYAAWHREAVAEITRTPRPHKRGMSQRCAEGARRRLSLVSA